jgi:DNA-binding NtrC family response regulator
MKLQTIDELIELNARDRIKLFDGDKVRTAESLGVSLKTLYNWIEKWSANSGPDRLFWQTQIREYADRVTTVAKQ